MSYVRVNKSEIENAKSKALELKDAFGDSKKHISDFRGGASTNSSRWSSDYSIVNKWKEYVKTKNSGNKNYGHNEDITDSKGVKTGERWVWYEDKVEEAAKIKIASAKSYYDESAKWVFGPGDKDNDTDGILGALNNIISLITEFENITPNLEEALNTILANSGGIPEGFEVHDMTINIDGEEVNVQTLVFIDDDGKEYTINEMVGAFYTETMVTISSDIAIAAIDPEASPEQREAILELIGENTREDTKSKLSKGMMSVASDAGIAGMYEAGMGEKYVKEEVHNKYMLSFSNVDSTKVTDKIAEVLGDETNASRIGTMGMAGLLITALNKNTMEEATNSPIDDINTDNIKDRKKKEDQTQQRVDGDDSQDTLQGDGTEAGPSISPEPVLPPGTEPNPSLEEPEPELPPEEPEPEEPIPENPEPVTKEVTPEVAQGVRDSISKNGELNTPDEMNKIDLTSDDIDNQARDEYYSDPDLAEKRVSAISEFENMSNEERVSSLEALGYTTVVAAGLVADKATGQAAYIIGIDEQNMANMSNALALQNGITNHNTRFDDGHNLSYFESGQAGVDMSPVTSEVQAARANLTTARGNYNAAVTTANDAITEANESKEKYNNTLSSIKKKKGDNPEDWSKDDVDEYNKVAEEYNAAVKNAEKAVEDAQSKKVVYEAEKANYDKAYEESVKKAQAGSQEVQDADDSDIINEMVPAEPDITEKVDDNGGFSTDPIPMVSPEELPSEQTPITPSHDVPTQGDSTQGSQLSPGDPIPDDAGVSYIE